MTTAGLSRPAAFLWPPLRRAWAWWTAELWALLPASLSAIAERPGTVVEAGRDDATLVLASRSAAPVRLPLTASTPGALRARVRAALRHHRGAAGATIRLDASQVLETALTLPVQAEAQLRPILSHQIEQLVPLPAHEVAFAWRIAPRAPAARMMTVQLAIVTQAALAHALALTRECGLIPRKVIAEIGTPAGTVVLWQADRVDDRPAWQRRVLRGLEAVALAGALTAYGLYLHRLDTVAATLRNDLEAASRVAAATRDLGRQLARSQEAVALLESRAARPSPLRVLDELTDRIPPPAWVNQLRLRGTTVELAGSAPRATDLIARLEASPLIEKPQFRAPITLAPDGRNERFDLSFGLRGR